MFIIIQKFNSRVYMNLQVCTYAQKGVFCDVHCSLIRNSSQVETIKRSSSKMMICGLSHNMLLHSP